jgi:hypothetical protein
MTTSIGKQGWMPDEYIYIKELDENLAFVFLES